MTHVVRHLRAEMPAVSTAPFLAADVGGTFARVGLVRAGGTGRPVEVLEYRKYVCAEFPGLGAILRDFLTATGACDIQRGALACAGFPHGDTVINTSLPWPLSLDALRCELDFRELTLVNDFMAVAYAIDYIAPGEAVLLSGSADDVPPAPSVVVGPGTGLGAAVRIPDGGRQIVLATEAGQSSFAPSTALEIEILGVLAREMGHVPVEAVVSGPGLRNLYRALCMLGDAPVALRAPAEITAAGINGSDAMAVKALEVFCGLVGGLAGDLVLLYGAQGGVWLAGGILPQIRSFVQKSTFTERFPDKGPMREVLERVPVRLIEHGRLGVIGAADWYLNRAPRTPQKARGDAAAPAR